MGNPDQLIGSRVDGCIDGLRDTLWQSGHGQNPRGMM
jgi:hypothetical protein